MTSRRDILKSALGVILATGLPWTGREKPVLSAALKFAGNRKPFSPFCMKVLTDTGKWLWAPGLTDVKFREPDSVDFEFEEIEVFQSLKVVAYELHHTSELLNKMFYGRHETLGTLYQDNILIPQTPIHPVCMCNGDRLRMTYSMNGVTGFFARNLSKESGVIIANLPDMKVKDVVAELLKQDQEADIFATWEGQEENFTIYVAVDGRVVIDADYDSYKLAWQQTKCHVCGKQARGMFSGKPVCFAHWPEIEPSEPEPRTIDWPNPGEFR